MALNKVNYVDGQTVITAENMNDIQDAIIALENAPTGGTVSDDLKQALLQLAQKVAYIDDQGQTYYDDLYNALYPPKTLVSISAVFDQGSAVIYDNASLDTLKTMLTVTAQYDDNTTEILPDSAYTLSGTLTVGTSTVTASYQGKTDTFDVTVTAAPTLSAISAVYTQSGTVYDTDSLDSLKDDLSVTAHYSDSSTQTVPAADYTLSGTLTVGTSTITVAYGGKTTTFNVTVTALSYVADGLVLWLDGEKNSANGAHVSNLTTWVDQSGNGWDFENVGATVNAKSLSFNGTSQYLKRAFDSLPHDVKMMEVVVNRTSGNNVISGFGNLYPGNITCGGSKYISFQIGTGTGDDKNAGFNLPDDIVGTVFSANSAGYINGTAIETRTDSNAWQYRYPCIGGYLGSGGTNFQYGFKGEIYCIRMYNRILTEQEILANYAVDAHRFGIGG